MSITKEKTAELVKKYGSNEKDSGSSEAQIAILTERINTVTDHLKENKKQYYLEVQKIRLLHINLRKY